MLGTGTPYGSTSSGMLSMNAGDRNGACAKQHLGFMESTTFLLRFLQQSDTVCIPCFPTLQRTWQQKTVKPLRLGYNRPGRGYSWADLHPHLWNSALTVLSANMKLQHICRQELTIPCARQSCCLARRALRLRCSAEQSAQDVDCRQEASRRHLLQSCAGAVLATSLLPQRAAHAGKSPDVGR